MEMVQNVNKHLKELNNGIVDNKNMKARHLGKTGLHLSRAGMESASKNVVSKLKHLVNSKLCKLSEVKNLKMKHAMNVLLGYVNKNSARNKMQGLFSLLENNIETLTIAETKLDSSFPISQFLEKRLQTTF